MFFSVMAEGLLRSPVMKKKSSQFIPYIPINRCTSDVRAVKEMKDLIAHKQSILVFPEARVTTYGETMDFDDSLIRLAKFFNVPIITYKIQGGYLKNPYWGGLRKGGSISGHIVKIYDVQEIQSSSLDDLYSNIKKDLYENSYETQKIQKCVFPDDDLAKGMDKYFFVCPKCKKMFVINSQNNLITCNNCGKLAKINEYGLFTENDDFFPSTIPWHKWQEQYFDELYGNQKHTNPLIKINNGDINEIMENHELEKYYNGKIIVYQDRLELIDENKVIPLKEIQSMFVVGNENPLIEFAIINQGRTFELKVGHDNTYSDMVHLYNIIRVYKKITD